MALDLIIKNPHIGEEHAEFKVKAQRSMTVRELKATLRDTYPTRPEASAQTLIHGGRVVRDEKKLDDVGPPFPCGRKERERAVTGRLHSNEAVR